MPRNTREWALRKLDAANNSIEWCTKHLGEVILKYEQPHPEISEPLNEIAMILFKAQELIEETKRRF